MIEIGLQILIDFYAVQISQNLVVYYVKIIDLVSKFRKIDQKWLGSRLFSGKKSPHKFSDTDPSDFIISKFSNIKQLFSLQKSKRTYSPQFKTISTVFYCNYLVYYNTICLVNLFTVK